MRIYDIYTTTVYVCIEVEKIEDQDEAESLVKVDSS